MAKISASILAADLGNLEDEVERVSQYIDEIHLDVMDGHYVPNLTFGLPMMEALKKVTNLPIDAHLMVTNPDELIPQFINLGASRIAFHPETVFHVHRTITRIKDLGAEAFITVNPGMSLSVIDEVIHYVDGVLVMSVNPGFSGQKFIERTYEKIMTLSFWRQEKGLNFKIAVDGGVGNDNALKLVQSGVNILIMGYGVFRNEKLPELKQKLKND